MTDRFDPKLKEFMAEITPIFEKFDLFGFVSVTNRTHGEFRFFLGSYSCAKIENGGLRIKAKGQKDHENLEATVFSLISMKEDAIRLFSMTEKIEQELRKHVEIDHKTPDVYGHGED